MPLETGEIKLFFGGISRDFAGISRGRPKSLRKKSLGSIFVPYFSAKICGFLAVSCALQMLESSGKGVNLQKSAVSCKISAFWAGLSL